MADMHKNQPVPSPGPLTATAAGGGNVEGIIFPSASRTAATYNSDELYNPNCRGVRIAVANDAAGGSTAVAKIQVRVPGTAVWVDLAGATTSTVNSSTGTIFTVYPGITGIADAAGVVCNQHLGTSWRVVLTIGTATGTSAVYGDYLL